MLPQAQPLQDPCCGLCGGGGPVSDWPGLRAVAPTLPGFLSPGHPADVAGAAGSGRHQESGHWPSQVCVGGLGCLCV